ncbi:MAG: hypothetical protein WD963_02425 [Candidatus Paceibacterota bacterium]
MPVLNVDEIKVTGNKVIETQMIAEVVEKTIEAKHWWLFPKTNIILYPKKEIKNKLNDQFTRIGNIDFSVQSEANKKVLEILITEREALYMWCGETLPEPVDVKCYFIDKEGYIFAESPYFSGEVYFKFYGSPIEGSKLFPDFQKLIFFKTALESIALKPVALHAQENGDIEVFLSAGNILPGPKVIFKKSSDFQKVVENLKAALDTEPLLSDFKNKYSTLEYIDLRFGNKVYYRFR